MKETLKATANEETFCGNIVSRNVSSARKQGNICWRRNMFLNKFRNLISSQEANFAFVTNVSWGPKTGKHLLPQQCFLVCGRLKQRRRLQQQQRHKRWISLVKSGKIIVYTWNTHFSTFRWRKLLWKQPCEITKVKVLTTTWAYNNEPFNFLSLL